MLSILDKIGLPYSSINTIYSNSAPIGSADADILVSLTEKHRPTEDYVRALRASLPREFPGADFYFLPADIVSQILNFGLPAPIDVQVVGKNVEANRELADRILDQMRHIPGIADLRIQQAFDQPKLHVVTDRTKAAESGYTQADVASSLLISLSGSFQTQPTFWLNPQNGVSYNVVTQTPQYGVQSLQDLRNIPLTVGQPRHAGNPQRRHLHQPRQRHGRGDPLRHPARGRHLRLGGRPRPGERGRRCGADRGRQPQEPGARLGDGACAGRWRPCATSFTGLLAGLLFAIVLVYLLIVVNFQSWLDPFIIITALPAALAGIVLMLFATHTTLSVPAMMGAIMCMGVATANSILVVSFAKEMLAAGRRPGATRRWPPASRASARC